MKAKFLLLPLISISCLAGCSNEQKEPEFPDVDDQYVDVLPSTNEYGPILQAFNWSYENVTNNLSAIKSAGFKIIQISPVTPPKNGGTTWWSYYQPLGFSIAETTPLGTKEQLKTLCEEADKQGIDVIADVVFNHLANISDNDLEADGTPKVNPNVANYEPIIYANRNVDSDGNGVTFHHRAPQIGCGSETQKYPYGALPDLNTSNSYVQSRCYNFLKECIDIGIDGFRFDAAKHIETPDDPEYSSSFWTNTLGAAKTYYSSKFSGKNLYAYGEILGDPLGRDISCYTKLMNVSDDSYNAKVSACIANKNFAPLTVEKPFGKKVDDFSSLVVWDESHDDVIDDSTNKLATGIVPDKTCIQKYAIISANNKITPMFHARPGTDVVVGEIGNYTFESEAIAEINRFGNRYKGTTQYLTASNQMFVAEKVKTDTDMGALIVGYLCANNEKEILLPNLQDGTYYDQVTGSRVTVYQGKTTLTFGEHGVCILTKTKDSLRPTIITTSRGETFFGSKTIKFSTKNTTASSYTINNGTPVSFTGEKSLTLDSSMAINNQIKLVIKAENTKYSKESTYIFKIVELIEGYFNVLNFDSSILINYELYEWAWGTNQSGKWIQVHHTQDGVLLCDFSSTNYTSFLLAKFPKGYTITKLNEWDNKCVSQTKDISISKGFFDAKGF